MSRYQPAPPRDRSPPRFLDRRPSGSYNGPPGPRNGDNPNQTPLDRAPPRGPKAQYDGPPRGRGGFRGSFAGRPEYRERENRPPIIPDRRDEVRSDWQRRDRDFNSGDRGAFAPRGGRGYIGRDRSASPVRTRRGSSEAVSLHNSRLEGPSNFYTPAARGGYTGRGGRGDWDRNRGRGSFASERDRDFLPPRSRSREDFAARDRDRARDLELDRKERSDRWEPDANRDRDLKPRDHDVWQRDRSTGRQSSGSGPVSSGPQTQNRGDQNASSGAFDPSRRRSTVLTPGLVREWRRDGDGPDYFGRTDQLRDAPLTRKLSPPPAPPSAAASALDYGPPPAAKPAEIPTELFPPQREPVPKLEPSAPSSSFLPPTGPKAERPAGPSNQAPPIKTSMNEQWPKQEPQPRTLRPAPLAPVMIRALEQPRLQEQSRDAMDLDRQSQMNVPSGPRASLITNKTRMLSQHGTTPVAVPVGPISAAKTSPVDFRSPIPTGPRSERDGLKSRPGPPWPTGNATWTSPDYKPRPSIMNNLQSKPPFDGREIHRPPMTAFNQPPKTRYQPPIIPRSRPAAEQLKKDDGSARVVVTDDSGRIVKPEEETDSAIDVDMSLNPSSDDEIDDDGLDEEDFAHSEEKFKKQMRQLEAMKPPQPLEDSIVVELLLRIQFLGLIIEGVPLQAIDSPIGGIDYDEKPTVTGLLSPEQRPEEKIHAPAPRRILGRPLSRLPVNPIPTPPLDDLPYLAKSSPKFDTFEESDDEVQHEAVITAMRTEFEKAAWQQREEIEELHSFYNDQYPAWRQATAELDRLKLDAKQPSPRPATPVPPTPIIIAQPSTTERPSRASMRNATEYDLEKAMEESKVMEQERKEAREREAAELEASGARPDYNLEAVVPDMIDASERDLSKFRDENRKVPPELALDVFEYIPPVDDFTEEEQIIFIKAFVAQPKRWGRIAESLPGRNYKQCIMHYYLTKNEASYKEIVRQSQPRKRRGRAPAKPRNTALGDLASSYDGGPIAVTDSGRPRRAAAPTFGEAGTDSEAVTPAPTGAKRGPRSTDAAAHSGDKPTRGRKAGAGAIKQRKKKVVVEPQQPIVQVLPEIPGGVMSPQKVQPPTPRAPIQRFKDMPIMPIMLEPAQPLDIHTSIEQDTVPAPGYHDTDRTGMTGFPGGSSAPQSTSYWSVPEQQKFPELVAYFGRDFVAIADFMKTKTSTMIKNFYTRELNTGKKELEDAAKRAENMRERGEPMGPPPTPVAPPKRRFEATPSMASLPPRPMTNLDMVAQDSMQGVVVAGPTMIDDFPANTIQRSARGELVAKPRTSRDILGPIIAQSDIQRGPEEINNQPARTPVLEPKQGPGPRPGFFPQERQDIRPASQGMRSTIHEQPAAPQPGHRLQDYANQLQQQRQSQFHQQSTKLVQDTPGRAPAQPEVARQPFYQIEPPAHQPPRDSIGHARRDSAGMGIAPPRERWERDGDPVSFRREPPHRGLQYGHMPTQTTQPGFPAMADPRREVTRPASTPLVPPPEPQKQAPSKRSNIFSLLDDGPSEPAPAKRVSLEGTFTQSVQSPSLSALGHENMRQRQPPRVNSPLAPHGSRPHYLQTATSRPGQPATPEFSTTFGGTPTPSGSHDKWMSRFDPRQQQSVGTEHSPVQIQPPVAQYGSTSQPSISRLHMDIPARQEPAHRSPIGPLQHPGSAPSPPPIMSGRVGTAIPPFRSGSSSSQQHQHNRVTSLNNYTPSQTPQLPGQSGSARSTPVSAVHQSRGSLTGYDDQRFAHQREHQLREQQMREQHQQREQQAREQAAREQEARQREYDLRQRQQHTYMQAQQQQRAQEMEQERYRYPGGPPRTYTPPTGQFPTPQQQQQQQQLQQQQQQQQQSGQHPSHYRHYSQGGAEERR